MQCKNSTVEGGCTDRTCSEALNCCSVNEMAAINQGLWEMTVNKAVIMGGGCVMTGRVPGPLYSLIFDLCNNVSK